MRGTITLEWDCAQAEREKSGRYCRVLGRYFCILHYMHRCRGSVQINALELEVWKAFFSHVTLSTAVQGYSIRLLKHSLDRSARILYLALKAFSRPQCKDTLFGS